MKKLFYNTPQPFSLFPVDPPQLEGEALLNKLLSDFEDWRYSVNNRYCEDDPKVRKKFEADIAAAEKSING